MHTTLDSAHPLDVTSPPERRRALLHGAVRVAPLVLGIAPFGFAIGAAGSASSLDPLTAWSSAVVVYGGSIQLVVLHLVESGATPAVIVLAALAATVPRCLYAVALGPGFGTTSLRWRALAAYLLVEPTFAVSAEQAGDPRPATDRYRRVVYLGAGTTVFVVWIAMTGLGALAGDRLPTGVGFELAVPVMMLALAAGSERTPPAWIGAAVAGACAVVLADLPLHSGFLAAIAAGMAGAVLADGRSG